jgi:hypothetical protein
MFQIDPTIYFIIVVPDHLPEDASVLQGFSPSLCRNSWMIHGAALSPTTIADLTDDGLETLLARKMSGNFPVHYHPQSPRTIRSMPLPPFMPFSLFLFPEDENIQDYEIWMKSCVIKPTIVAQTGGDLRFKDLMPEVLREHFLNILTKMPTEADPASVAIMVEKLSSWKPAPSRRLDYQVGGHGSVAPNLMALTMAGFDDLVYGPLKEISNDQKPYVDQIARTAISILDERERIGERDLQRIFRPTPDVNIFAPNIYPHFFSLPLPKDLPFPERKAFETTRHILKQQTGYSFTANTESQKKAILGGSISQKNPPSIHPLFFVRAQEISLGTEVMGALAASEFSAVLRLPNDINRTIGAVRSFAEHYRSRAPTKRKRLIAFRRVQERLAAAFPIEFNNIIRRSKSGIRIVSDAHLEWLNVDGLPLMIQKTCSRIPVTPGNLFVEQVKGQNLIQLSPDELRKILILSALKPTDPISGLFEQALQVFGESWEGKLEITNVQVASEDDMVRAINSFDGYLLVFDGHGGHDIDQPGKLWLRDQPVDVWDLRKKIRRMPPIVLLSACDTHAADRNHATTASGFLSMGARTVLASVFPIDGRVAAIFTARFLFRISDYLTAAIALFDQGLRWSDVVSGMLRMQLLTDFLRSLLAQKLIDHATYLRIHMNGNNAINSDADNPFDFVSKALEEAGLEKRVVTKELEMAVANSDVISYLQLGRPETILIDDTARMKKQMEELSARNG